MKLIAKAALGALALASAFAATVPANAAVVERTTTVVIHHNGCFNGNCLHRGNVMRRHLVRRAIRHELMREAMRHEMHRAARQAFLEHRYQYNR